MIISGGHLIAIDKVRTDETLSGNGSFRPLGVKTVSSVSALSSLSSDLSGKILNGNAISDVVKEIDKKITSASPSLKNDIEVTNSVGMVFEGTTLSAGTNFEDIFTSAFKKYVEPSVTLSLTPSTTTYSYDVSGTFEKEFTVTAKFVPGSLPITSCTFMNQSILDKPLDKETTWELIDSEDPIIIDGEGKTTIDIKVYTEQTSANDSKTINVTKRFPVYYGTILKEEYNIDSLTEEYVSENFIRKNTTEMNATTNNLNITFENDKNETIYLFLISPKNIKTVKQLPADVNVTPNWEKIKTLLFYDKSYNVFKYFNPVTNNPNMKFEMEG